MSTAEKVCIVIGGSHAGGQLADSVRRNGWEGKILVITDEAYLPYHRPPLSKDFLAGKKSVDDILIKPASAYEKQNIEFRLNTWVEKIDRRNKALVLADGTTLHYDKLGLTTGARAREIHIPGDHKEGVHYLRTIEDIDNIRPFVRQNGDAIIVGGGYIGLETAACLRKLGMNVTVFEMMPRILQRVTSEELSRFYTRVHTEEGVRIITEDGVSEILGEDCVSSVLDARGQQHPADLVIIGAGILPNSELAAMAGLEVDNGGIKVDEFARTSDPDIVAAGDCTWHYNPIYDRWLRLESVQNALEQARVAGATVCDKPEPYSALPWFWSDQYDMKLQIAGLSQGFDDIVIRGDIENSREFAAFYYQGDRLLAVDAINMPAAFMIGKRLLMAGKSPTKAQVADPDVDFKSLL
jgi:3-phenylpropionate/trans-cinnamate dioxygenase ferredoxin reductase component